MRRINKFMNIVNFMLIIILIVSFMLVINMDVNTYSLNIKNEHLLTYLNSNHIEKVILLDEELEQTIIENKKDKTIIEEVNPVSKDRVVTNNNESSNKEVGVIKKEISL